jgi:hypothetical protein
MPEFCAIDTPILDLLINDSAPRAIYDDGNGNTYFSVTFEVETKNINGKTIFLRLDENPANLQEIGPDGEYPISYAVIKLIGDTSDMELVPRFTIIPLTRDEYNNDTPMPWLNSIITGDYTIILSDYSWYTQGYYNEYVEPLNFLYIPENDANSGVNLIGIPSVDKTTMRLLTYLS